MHIVLVWFGAVGFVLIQILEELSRTKWIQHTYTILVRSNTIQDELESLWINANIVLVWDMAWFFANKKTVGFHVDWTINCATPIFNIAIMEWCLNQKSNYMDLASLLSPDDIRAWHVQQDALHESFVQAWLLAVVNAGISPWLTEVLTGYMITKHAIVPRSYNLYLDENFNSMIPLFSRSPSVAIDEMLTPAFVLDDGNVRIDKPFTLLWYCVWSKCFNYYEITQEEAVWMYRHYKDSLHTMKIVAGWSEVEHLKLLYTMGLLSSEKVWEKLTLLDIIKSKMPKAATKEEMIDAWEKSLIDDAWFSFQIELQWSDKLYTIRCVFDFSAFKSLKQTSYYGATSISYPTWLGAGYIRWLAQWFSWKGVVSCLDIGLQVEEESLLTMLSALKDKGIVTTME